MFGKMLALAIALVCLALLVRMFLGPRRQSILDQWVKSALLSIKRVWARRSEDKYSAERAERAAQQAINRAKAGGQWKGNVFTPNAFKKPKKPD